MAIVNATVPVGNGEVQIPFSVQPVGITPTTVAQPAGGANIGGIAIDQATIGTFITLITGAIGTLIYKQKKDNEKEDRRSNIIAETSLKQVQSLQETDKADYIFRQAVVDYITNPDEGKKQKLIELAHESKQNYKAYYENIQPQPLDYDKDPVVRKISAVDKRVTPSPTTTTDD